MSKSAIVNLSRDFLFSHEICTVTKKQMVKFDFPTITSEENKKYNLHAATLTLIMQYRKETNYKMPKPKPKPKLEVSIDTPKDIRTMKSKLRKLKAISLELLEQ